MSTTNSNGGKALAWWRALFAWWPRLAKQHPIIGFFLVIIWPNALWSVANLVYNDQLIVERFCPEVAQKAIFWDLAVPLYSTLTWVVGMGICIWLIYPVWVYFRALEGRRELTADQKKAAQRRLVNLPWYQLVCNFFLWLPGGIYFPLMIYFFGGPIKPDEPLAILVQFLASFLVSAVVTSFQTYVLLEGFLLEYVYPRVFTDISPGEVEGGIRLSFSLRLILVWGAVSLGPIIVLVLITVNLLVPTERPVPMVLTVGVVIFGVFTGGVIFWTVGQDLARWLETHMAATREIAKENFAVRIGELRADEWGRLTDSFNKMARDLSLGRHVYETFGQFVGPEVRDKILQRYSGLGGKVEEITVMFADIRGFTSRAAGRAPEEGVELLNRFLSLAVQAVEEKGGWVNKFLGDGFMALFGTPLPNSDHADLAVAAAGDLLGRLKGLNCDLGQHGQAPLKVGIGIHTGPALVGCIGATVPLGDGRQQMRLELTAIGETVNTTQRLEELTKTCGATVLLSEATRLCLQNPPKLDCMGAQEIRGGKNAVVVYTIPGL